MLDIIADVYKTLQEAERVNRESNFVFRFMEQSKRPNEDFPDDAYLPERIDFAEESIVGYYQYYPIKNNEKRRLTQIFIVDGDYHVLA